MVYLFLANGCEEIEALTPVDLLRRAGIAVTTVGVGGKSVTGSHGIRIGADIADTEYHDEKPEGVILPGGMPGTLNLEASPVVKNVLVAAKAGGSVIAAICAAPSILGHLGYLFGKNATCYPGFETALLGAKVIENAPVVEDGNFITSRGMGTAVDFALALVARFASPEAAEKLAESIQYK